ncbi:MAG: RecX family transcriptional regulator [Kaistella sp.]|nr:RecX family transcriptional regulator [Kaistella sp.]
MYVEHKSYTFLEIKQKMVNYCVYQDRCHQEVEQKMRDYLVIPEAKEEILLYLMKENFLNEERFTRSYIRGKFYMKSWGRNKIKNHLKFKGISEKLINRCFDEIDEQDYENILKKIYENHYSKQKGLKEYQKKSKTITYLIGRGFEYEEIRRVMEGDEEGM